MVKNPCSEVILLLGSNIGERDNWLAEALESVSNRLGGVIQSSGIYETEPWGFSANQSFLNQAVKLKTSLGPRSILHGIWEIERALGRVRSDGTYSSRTIDIDILTWEHRIFWTKKLQVPHIHIQNRRFALVPLAELAGEEIHPILSKSYNELLRICPDQTSVKPFSPFHV
jgi:2-amino-4-hydroxy-6-hydroxymethyldihydropteridine diphosphokinase